MCESSRYVIPHYIECKSAENDRRTTNKMTDRERDQKNEPKTATKREKKTYLQTIPIQKEEEEEDITAIKRRNSHKREMYYRQIPALPYQLPQYPVTYKMSKIKLQHPM